MSMKLLLIGTDDGIVPCAAVAARLKSVGHKVTVAAPPEDPASAAKLVKNIEQVVLLPATADRTDDGRTWLDMVSRGVYDLLMAAAAAESTVWRCVVVSPMDMFLSYPSTYLPTNEWQPKPTTDPVQLGPHLAEFVLREFTRGSRLAGVVLRVGRPEASRFLLSEAAATDGILELVQREDDVSAGSAREQVLQYRVEHLLDPACLVFDDEANAAAAHAADAAAAAAAASQPPAAAAASEIKKVLLLGANGMLGPPVVNELGDSYALTVTDLNPYGWRKEGDEIVTGTGDRDDIDLIKPLDQFAQPCQSELLDVSDQAAVAAATASADVTVNCAVLRPHPKLAFDVNTAGTYYAISAAVAAGHQRFINTGPHFTVVGDTYTVYDYEISEEVPPHPGLGLYAISKGIGQEICRVFALNHPIHVLLCLFLSFPPGNTADRLGGPESPGGGTNAFSVTFADAARCIKAALQVELSALPSQNEVFFVTSDLPHGRYSNAKARRLLGWAPLDLFTGYYTKPIKEAAAKL